jgi:hypothetical protein
MVRAPEDAGECPAAWSEPPEFELTLVMAWRNDDYGGAGAIPRLQRTLDVLNWQVKTTNASVELLIVEYDPPAGRERLREAVRLPRDVPAVRVIEAGRAFARRVDSFFPGRRNVPTPWAETRNLAIRRARGAYVTPVATNSVLSTAFYRMVAQRGALRRSEKGHARVLHRIPKVYVDREVPAGTSVERVEEFLAEHGKEQTFVYTSAEPDKAVLEFTAAAGDFQLMSRDNWHRLRGYWECPSYAHHDSILHYQADAEGFVGVVHQGMLVLHQYHEEGGFYKNLKLVTVPETDYGYFKRTRVLNSNTCDWGYALQSFPEHSLRRGVVAAQVVGFYQMFLLSDRNSFPLYREHLAQISASDVFGSTSAVHVSLIGGGETIRGEAKQLLKERFVVSSEQEEGDEGVSLKQAWDHCRANPADIVWYLHGKGSFHPSRENDDLRRALTASVMHRDCLAQLRAGGRDACGMRFSRIPHWHYSGNMWLARCSLLAGLPDPLAPRGRTCGGSGVTEEWAFAPTGDPKAKCRVIWCVAGGRYRFEHWIGMNASALFSDCLGHTVDAAQRTHAFIFGYIGSELLASYNKTCDVAPRNHLFVSRLLLAHSSF